MNALFTVQSLQMACRLTSQERKRIKYLRDKKHYSRRAIGEILWRNHSVLSREYKRNKKRWGYYDPGYADHKAYRRKYEKRKQSKTIRSNDVLECYVISHLEIWRSAEQVAWRWNSIDRKLYYQTITISWLSIRRYIDSKFWSYLKYTLIQEKKLKRYKKKAKHGKRQWGTIKNRVFIDVRPQIISQKTELWHVEVDFIESTKDDTTVILTIIDKCSRKKYAYLLDDRTSERVYMVLRQLITEHQIQSMTFDNDNWFAKHYQLWIPTYFCHTYSSREKWQIEYGNRWYRRFFPKWTILKNISQEDVQEATNYLNTLPLKCLLYLCSLEYHNQKISHVKTIFSPSLLLTHKVVQ